MINKKSIINFFAKHWLFLVWLFFGSLLLVYAFTQKPYPTGDAAEYIFMTEAFINHQSPDIRYEDFESFYRDQSTKSNWAEMGKQDFFLAIADTIKNFTTLNSNFLLNHEYIGFVGSEKRKVISIHFFIYPLLNVPVRLLLKPFKVEPLKVYQITNVLLFVLFICYVVFCFSFEPKVRTALFFMLLFSPAYWYLGWVHADLMICIFTGLGLLLFYKQKPLTGMFLVALAGTQNQPLVFLLAYMGFVYWKEHNFKVFAAFKAIVACVIILWPSLYNYIHFGKTSLISSSGYTGLQYVSFARIYGFFFDLNQGLIYALPFLLPYFIYIVIKQIIQLKINMNYLLILVVFAMVFSFSILKLWNMGQAIVSRYAAWVAYIFIAFFIWQVSKGNIKPKIVYFASAVQVLAFLLLTPVPKNILIHEWNSDKMKWPSKWVLEYLPSMYNPDPDIFAMRVAAKNAEWADLPIYYFGSNQKIKKVLIRKGNPEKLYLPGIDSSLTLSLQQNAAYNKLGFAYINQNQLYP
ncbi:MAG: hypothetical protein ACK4K9_03915 [Bacteroidia bacterium]